jgi:hypothetical protein
MKENARPRPAAGDWLRRALAELDHLEHGLPGGSGLRLREMLDIVKAPGGGTYALCRMAAARRYTNLAHRLVPQMVEHLEDAI